MRQEYSQEHGQSMILIVLGLAVLMAFMALAVDGGNVYAQRRQVQNAVDAAAYAGGQRLAQPNSGCSVGQICRATNGQVLTAIQNAAVRNGVAANTIKATYVMRQSNGVEVHDNEFIGGGGLGTGAVAPVTLDGLPVVGVYVTADKEFNSFFAGIVGITTMTVGAPSTGYGAPAPNPPNTPPPVTSNGTCCSDNLFPVTLPQTTFPDENNDGIRDVHFEQNDPGYNYQIWDRDGEEGPGNFGYLMWRDQNSSTPTLIANMADPSRSGIWYVGDDVSGSTGVSNASGVRQQWIDHIGKYIIIPIYDTASGTGNNLTYNIVGFARFKVTGYCRYNNYNGECDVTLNNNSDPYVQGKFQNWSTSLCEGSCPNYGIVTTTNHPPLTQTRSLIGVVKINQLEPAGETNLAKTPVDVIHVLDISGSMNSKFGKPSTVKLSAAKQALINFNNVLSPTLNGTDGDRVGLATFPLVSSMKSYKRPCGGNDTSKAIGQKRLDLTDNIASVNSKINSLSANGITPIAGGLLVGRGMVTDPSFHDPSHVPVIILASDGLANVVLDGRYTGFDGMSYNPKPCNAQADQDAIYQANQAKADNDGDGKPDAIVFTIAIGTDFNPVTLQAIASAPTETHFYQATDAASMASIYNQISTVIESETCLVNQREIFAPNVTVRVRNTDTGTTLTTTATSTGYFQFNNIDPGTYEFQSISITLNNLTYDIFTDGVGGPVLADPPTIEIGSGTGTYEKNLSLKTDDFVCTGTQ
ncbi:MAG: hypothetical protein HDKAJFGB_03711 [Anaerolineae bacterium]|nr:hypothetical protein [Anaerolineae bacterium]